MTNKGHISYSGAFEIFLILIRGMLIKCKAWGILKNEMLASCMHSIFKR
jgi:hypothetical protein